MRPDVLAGMSRRQRQRREAKDIDYLVKDQEIHAFVGNPPKGFKGNFNKLKDIGIKTVGPDYIPQEKEIVICLRVDIDHPIRFSDNVFGNCVDCGTDIQFRPDLPSGPERLCICCAARRMRESHEHQ